MSAAAAPLLEVSDLAIDFRTHDGTFRAVDGVSFSIDAGRALGVVGESGCGKSVTALSIMGLIPQPPGHVAAGSIRFEGVDLLTMPASEMRNLRGNALAMIFQEPMTSLNPAFTIGDQIVEGLLRHTSMTRDDARRHAIAMLERVRIPSPRQRIDDYPHRLSGGMRQRAMIAMALACEPRLLIADEPTTALDVTIQAQILELMRTLRRETGTAVMLITHDLGVVAEFADDVIVMYAGRVVERASVGELFDEPQHPYTIGLLGSIPRLDLDQPRLAAIEGQVPMRIANIRGCAFAPRCPFAIDKCRNEAPPLMQVGSSGHFAACWRAPLDAIVGDSASTAVDASVRIPAMQQGPA
jgi:peptide/nickel transport system ATP-binding protein